MTGRKTTLSIVVGVIFLLAAGVPRAQQPAPQKPAADPAAFTVDDKSIGGTVTSRFGPEAGSGLSPRPGISAPASPRSSSPTNAAAM
jgi:hypothetical protein